MTDKAVELQATDLFAVSTGWEAQRSSTSQAQTHTPMKSNLGNIQREVESDNRTDYTCEYESDGTVAGNTKGVITDFGGISDSKAVTEVSISLAAGESAKMTVDTSQAARYWGRMVFGIEPRNSIFFKPNWPTFSRRG